MESEKTLFTQMDEMEAHRIIKAKRLYLEMTQAQAAQKAGVPLGVYQKYENLPGSVLQGRFSDVCKVLEVLHLNPRKFFQGKYELNAIGYQVTSRGTGPLNHILRKALRICCPVTCKNKR